LASRLSCSLVLGFALVIPGTGASIAQCPTPSFGPPTIFPAGDGPQALAVGDFDEDGTPDLAEANENSFDVYIFLGGFNLVPVPFPTGEVDPSGGLAVGDFNGDGHLDLVVSGGFFHPLVLLLGDGRGSFGPPTGVGGMSGISVAAGDFNSDGTDDLAVATSDSVSILLGPSLTGGTFPAGGRAFTRNSIAVGDFNGDGDLDVVVTNPGSDFAGNTVLVLLGEGTGGLSDAASFTVGANPASLVVGKFNADNVLDLAVLNQDASSVSILLGDGNGGFVPHATLPGGVEWIAAGDFNCDGNLDLADTVSVSLGDGTGGFCPFTPIDVQVNSHSVAVADFNRDGKPDLAFAGEGGDNVEILLNTCTAPKSGFKVLRDLINGLPDTALKAVGLRSAMLSVLADTETANASGETDEAVRKLQNLRRHFDGCPPAADTNDWIIDCEAQVRFRTLLDGLIASLGG